MGEEKINKLYTKRGDKGKTQLPDGSWVNKNVPVINAIGDIDELNSLLALVSSLEIPSEVKKELLKIQNFLFILSADIGTLSDTNVRRIQDKDVLWLEERIDYYSNSLERLRNFIVPGGSKEGALVYLARAVARRAERTMTVLYNKKQINTAAFRFINRLSDYLFVVSRWLNREKGIKEYPVDFREELV